ncbi:Abi family protein [Microlunatus parietis]|uniref:Abortive infection bacteriophage resistance protein n=1 Tax=Microlunatus parietis TaxID=682979 RepID=A0A7Y9LDH7_9ACTN|nr:Abi family protein [Microlunatus parietis]NYE73907.1 abortive infection bacteriophage resistance protein [Microlunatus parietis]
MSTDVKEFKSYEALADVLADRGMDIGHREDAVARLRDISYYRLSGYWYPFRRQTRNGRSDAFYKGTTLADVMKLYQFDAILRTATFDALGPVELRLRTSLGHELGSVDECVHLRPGLLGPRARARNGADYTRWLQTYENERSRSREDFVAHHDRKYGGRLPVWVAVEILDWGSLMYLFGFSPRDVQDTVAAEFALSAPQLESWLRCLNFVRNVCAHHGRLFNRVHPLQPRLPVRGLIPAIDEARGVMNRTYGQLCLLQHMLSRTGSGRSRVLASALRSFPTDVPTVPLSHTGTPADWQSSPLWKT